MYKSIRCFADMVNEKYSSAHIKDIEYERYVKPEPKAVERCSEGAIFTGADFGHTMPDWNVYLRI